MNTYTKNLGVFISFLEVDDFVFAKVDDQVRGLPVEPVGHLHAVAR